jgi:hypothetical protein
MVLGLGGGIGAAAFVFEYKGHPPTFYVATRCQPQYAYDAGFVRTAAERLGARAEIVESSSPGAAGKKLEALVAKGPVMAWLSLGGLPWSPGMGPAAELGPVPHVVVVDALDAETAHVWDLAPSRLALPRPLLGEARARLRSAKHRLLTVEQGRAVDLRAAVREAVAACAAELGGKTKIRGPMAKNFGLGGLERWRNALVDPKDPKRWTKVFPPKHAAQVLAWLRHWIDLAGTGGGGFRPMYADFLDEAADLLRVPAWRALARDYRALGAEWSALATFALGPFPGIREAQDARQRAAVRADVPALRAAEKRLFALLRDAPLLDDATLAAHYAELASRLAAILESEAICSRRLAA